jgi:hypothetical protein
MAIPKLKVLQNLDEGQKKMVKPILYGALVVLLGAFGLTASSTNMDLGKFFSTGSVDQSMIKPTAVPAKNNVMKSQVSKAPAKNSSMTPAPLKKDAQGNLLPENCQTNNYNCSNFQYQEDAQALYDKCGGSSNDVNRLDANKDGKACESLPKKNK